MVTTKPKKVVIEKKKLNAICTQQKKLFDGYLRTEVREIDVWDEIPLDLIRLCYTFFDINILRQLINTKDDEIDVNILHKLAGSLYDTCEFFVSYLILSILIKDHVGVPKYHNLLGMVLQDWGSSSVRSEKEFEIAISLKPHSHIYKWNYGILLIDQEKYDKALKQFMNASVLDKDEAEYYKKMALCYQHLKDYKNAKKNYLKCISLKKKESKYYLIYARFLHEEVGNYEESKKYYKLSIDLEEKNNETDRVCDYYVEYAELLKKMQKYDEIENIYAKCIEFDNENKSKYYYLYARLYRDDYRNYALSEEYYLKCLAMNEKYDGCNGSYGHLLYLMGRYEQSAKYLKIACSLDEKNIWTYYYYGLLMKQMNDFDESQRALQRALIMFKLNCCDNYKNAYMLRENMKPHLDKTKVVDGKHCDYHEQFEQSITDFVQRLRPKN